jgi:hypothetical protein
MAEHLLHGVFQPHLFWDSKLFDGLNIVGGGDYFCVNGMVHGRQDTMVFDRMRVTLNTSTSFQRTRSFFTMMNAMLRFQLRG